MTLVLEAVFVMVARNPLTNKSALVNGLEATTPEEQRVLSTSQLHQNQRKQMSKESLLKVAPNESERQLIHDMFLDTLDPRASTFKIRVKPEGKNHRLLMNTCTSSSGSQLLACGIVS